MSKEKKRIKEQMLVNQAIASIKKHISDLEASRKKYIEAAASARRDGIASQYNLAKNAIRIVTAQKNAVEQMLLNLQISSQIKDVSEMTKAFADGMKLLSGSIVQTSDKLDFEKVSKQMNNAVISTQLKQAEVDAFMDGTQSGFSAVTDGADIGADELDAMIAEEMNGGLDDDIAELERKIESGMNKVNSK